MVVTERSASVMIQNASAVPQSVGRQHAPALAHGPQGSKLIFGRELAGVEVHVPGDEVDGILAGGGEGVEGPRRGHEPAEQDRGVPKGAGPGRTEHDQGLSGFATTMPGAWASALAPRC